MIAKVLDFAKNIRITGSTEPPEPPPTKCRTMIRQGDYYSFILPYQEINGFQGMEQLEDIPL